MNEEQVQIVGFLNVDDTALCVTCANKAYYVNTALGSGLLHTIRHEHVQDISADLHCVCCVKVLAKKGGECT